MPGKQDKKQKPFWLQDRIQKPNQGGFGPDKSTGRRYCLSGTKDKIRR